MKQSVNIIYFGEIFTRESAQLKYRSKIIWYLVVVRLQLIQYLFVWMERLHPHSSVAMWRMTNTIHLNLRYKLQDESSNDAFTALDYVVESMASIIRLESVVIESEAQLETDTFGMQIRRMGFQLKISATLFGYPQL